MPKIPRQTHSLELTIKRSRFVATVMPLTSPEQVVALLADRHDTSASHHCWAWQFDAQYRSDDDGEPRGTAGRPILAAITTQGFDHVLVLVQRWFGGIKLGKGGLARAYGGSAAKCLQKTPSQALMQMAKMHLQCAHEHIGSVHTACQTHQASILQQDWLEDRVRLDIELPAAQIPALRAQLRDASSGQIQCWAEQRSG